MNLSETAANIRPRNPYEAMDLGASMVRLWWKELWFIWFAVSLPFAIFFWFALYDFRAWTVLAIWWCKPLWETPMLHFIAEKLFQGDINAKSVIKKSPKLIAHDVLLKLTVRRFSITRSFDMPVSELERLKGTQRNKRLNVLHRTSSSAAIWLTIVGTHLETMIVMALVSFIWMFIPEYMAFDMDVFDVLIAEEFESARFVFAYLAMSLIGPFYVAAGFCLYINRRTILEGWDIELRFKQLMHRVQAPAAAKLLMVCSLCFSLFSLTPSDAMADEGYTPKQSREDIINILESDDFNVIEEEEVLLPKDRDLEVEEEEDSDLIKSVAKFFGYIAQSVEVILWAILIAVIVYVLIKLNQYRISRANGPAKLKREKTPDSLFGLDIRKDSLPEDITQAARDFWQQNLFREAYSLLYRGALIHIAHDKEVPLHESFTEEECVAQFQDHDDGLEPLFFAQLTQQWQMVAYGHQPPTASIFETTCDGWQFHFGGDHEQ